MSEENMAQRIRELRRLRGLTLEQVATQVGVGKSTVRKWETGIIANMRRDKIAALAKALHTTPAYLMGWEDNTGRADLRTIAADIAPQIGATPEEVLLEIDELPWSTEEMRTHKGLKEIKRAVEQRRAYVDETLLSAEALALAKCYDALDSWGKKQLRMVADNEIARCNGSQNPKKQV